VSGETRARVSGWTIDTLATHHDTIRQMQDKFDIERDRRYAEVATEREKALKIKETADLAALGLAREIQTYKDEKANQLREQISGERGMYPTKSELNGVVEKIDAQLKPINEFVSAARGHIGGTKAVQSNIAWVVALIASLIAIGTFVFRTTPTVPQIIYVPAQPGTLIPSPAPQQQAPR